MGMEHEWENKGMEKIEFESHYLDRLESKEHIASNCMWDFLNEM
jgi:hypothetical protein